MLLYFSASSFHVGCSLWQWPHLDMREANMGDLMHYGKLRVYIFITVYVNTVFWMQTQAHCFSIFCFLLFDNKTNTYPLH